MTPRISRTPRAIRSARLLACTLAIGAATSIASPVFAQSNNNNNQNNQNELTPPVPAPPRNPPSFLLGIGVALLLGSLVVGVNFMPSKRGHQD